MSSDQTARVLDLKSIERFKAALAEYGDSVKTGLLEADSEIERAIVWLERDRLGYWKRQIQRRSEELAMAKSALFRKETQGSAKDGRPSVVDEKLALEKAKRRLHSAEERFQACRRWRTRLEREYATYKGHIQPLASASERGIPEALALLNRILEHLEAYVRGDSGAKADIEQLLTEDDRRSMKRGGSDESTDNLDANDQGDAPQ